MIVNCKSIFFLSDLAYMTTAGGDYLLGNPALGTVVKIGEEEYLTAYRLMMTKEYEEGKKENG